MVLGRAAAHAGSMDPHAVDDPPRSSPTRPPARRSTSDRYVGGVSSAVADYLGVSLTISRIVLAAGILLGGLGLVVYSAVWLFVPDDQDHVLIHGQVLTASESVLAALLAGAASLSLSGWITRDGPSVWVALLVTTGVFILSRRGGTASEPDLHRLPESEVPPVPISQDPMPWNASSSETAVLPLSPDRTTVLTRAAVSGAPTPHDARSGRPPKASRPASFVGPFTVSIAVAVAGSLTLLHAIGAIALQPSDVLITVLAVVGVGLLVSTWIGRGRGLILLGLLLLPVVAVSTVIDRVDLRGGIGERIWTPQNATELRPAYRLGAGSLQLDLTEMETSSPSVSTRISLGAGDLQLVVPEDWGLQIDSTVDIGTVWIYDQGRLVEDPVVGSASVRSIAGQDWFFRDRQEVPNDPKQTGENVRILQVAGREGAPTIQADLRVTAGVVEVFRVQS